MRSVRIPRFPLWLPPIAVVLLALGVRLAWCVAVDFDPSQTFRFDMSWYDVVARNIAAGKGFVGFHGEPTAAWPPGYPFFLSGIYKLSGGSVLAATIANSLLGAATVGLTYLLGARLFDRRTGLLAAAVLAIFPGHVFFTAATMAEVPFTAVLTLILLLFAMWHDRLDPGRWRWLLFGALLGVASLVRGEALLFLVVPAAVLWLSRRSLARAAGPIALAGVGLVAVVAPWTVRNYLVMDYPAVVSTGSAEAFWLGHWELADGKIAQAPDPWASYSEIAPPRGEVERSKAELREGLRYMLTHPVEELRLVPKKLYYLYQNDHIGLDWLKDKDGRIFGRPLHGPLSWTADAYFFAVLGLSIAAVPWLIRRGRPGVFIVLVVAYYSVLHGFVFFGDPRYHVPLLPVLSLMAAFGLAACIEWARTRSESRAANSA